MKKRHQRQLRAKLDKEERWLKEHGYGKPPRNNDDVAKSHGFDPKSAFRKPKENK